MVERARVFSRLGRPLAVTLLLLAAAAGGFLLSLPRVGRIVFRGVPPEVPHQALVALLHRDLGRSWFFLDLDRVRRRLLRIPWVSRASVRRRWPRSLVVRLRTRHAVARWNGVGLLDRRGRLFALARGGFDRGLPRLSGPPGSLALVFAEFRLWWPLLARAHLRPVALRMDRRGGVALRLRRGPVLRLGARDRHARLLLFLTAALPVLRPRWRRVRYVDLRYPSGFAVGWRSVARNVS
jgi:cell division protein FtsQ